jgi:uncharacterized membrane protein YdjX (TVP38/TMEM64 family)
LVTKKKPQKKIFAALLTTAVLAALIFFFVVTGEEISGWVSLLGDEHQLRERIAAYGNLAPLAFIVLQVLQVILAPVPGEATGLLGGFFFGTANGFIYSTIALAIGSGLAFLIGRSFSTFFKEKFQKTKMYRRFNRLVCKGDFAIPFVLFLFPGFPKDSLSYLLGLSLMPFKVFLFIATVARMPGTLMLSIQGAEIHHGNYLKLAILLLISAAVALPCYIFRRQILAFLLRHKYKK